MSRLSALATARKINGQTPRISRAAATYANSFLKIIHSTINYPTFACIRHVKSYSYPMKLPMIQYMTVMNPTSTMTLPTCPSSPSGDHLFDNDTAEINYCYSAILMNALPCDGENPFLLTQPHKDCRRNSEYINTFTETKKFETTPKTGLRHSFIGLMKMCYSFKTKVR